MKIIFTSNVYYSENCPGGPSAHIGQFLKNAAAMGHDLWLWNGLHPSAGSLERKTIPFLKELGNADVLYMRIAGPELRFPATFLPFLSLWPKRPLVVWELNDVPVEGAGWWTDPGQANAQLKRFGRHADLTICVSERMAEYARDLGLKDVVVAPNGSDPDHFNPEAEPVSRIAQSAALNVVWMGHINFPWHLQWLLRRAARHLWDAGHGDRVRFFIIGHSADMGMMREMPPNVEYCGPETYAALPRWLASMDVGLCLYSPESGQYSSPLKFFDYLASGLAVVSTHQPQIDGIMKEMGCEDLLVPRDAARLAETLLRLAADKAKVKRIGLAGRQLIVERYNWRNTTALIFDEIRKKRVRAS